MNGDKLIFVMYDDDDKLMDGAKHLVANEETLAKNIEIKLKEPKSHLNIGLQG